MSVVFNKGQKYCINCKWHELVDDVDDGHDHKCESPKNISVNLVTGHVIKNIYHPDFLRTKRSGGCGIDGKWFEKRGTTSKRRV